MIRTRVWLVLLLTGIALFDVKVAMCVAGDSFGAGPAPAYVEKKINAGDFGGQGVTRAQLARFLPPPKPHPFEEGAHHVVRQLNGENEPVSLPAEVQLVNKPWNGERAMMPYLVYMPEKDRLLMEVSCGPESYVNSHPAVTTSDDHGKTWSPRRWLSVDKAGQSMMQQGLTYLGQGKLLAIDGAFTDLWVSSDYGQTWEKSEPKQPHQERYSWDPLLVITGADGRVERLVHEYWTRSPTHGCQGWLRSSLDEGRSWSDGMEVPQWLGCGEINIIVAKNGDWVAACRTNPPDHQTFDHYCGLVVSISKDQGQTWSPTKTLYEWGRHNSSMVLLPDGRIVMSYIVRLGYPPTADGFPQFGVDAVVSRDNGQTWDLEHRYILATWVGNIKGDNDWHCGPQTSSTVLLPDGAILTAFGTGFRSTTPGDRGEVIMDVALVKWRVNPQVLGTNK